jgi:Tol biopolymer transport system component
VISSQQYRARIAAPILVLALVGCDDGGACDTSHPLMPVCTVAVTDPPVTEPSLLVASNRDGPLEIYVMNSDGTRPRRLTNNTGNDVTPAWSPDGARVLFASTRPGVTGRQLYVMAADGSDVRQLTSMAGNPGFGTWSPDGQHIAFHALREDGSFDIWVMNADGTDMRRLTSTNNQMRPRWSPDGQRLVFVWHQHSAGNLAWGHVAVMNADGTGLTVLGGPALQGLDPDWSPDGRQIAFSTWEQVNGALQGMMRLAIMNADGSGQRLLGPNTLGAAEIAWSRTTGRIYFASNVLSSWQIFSVRPNGTDLRRITPLPYTAHVQPHAR